MIPAAVQPAALPTHVERQTRYLDGLIQTWKAHKGESLERWNYLVQMTQTLQTQRLGEQQRLQAQQMAHSLAGTLGTFGLMEGYRLSRQIEQLLQQETALLPTQCSQLQTLVTTLGHALDESPKLTDAVEEAPASPRMLIIDLDNVPYIQQFMALAIAQGFEATTVASVEAAARSCGLGASSPAPPPPPDTLIVITAELPAPLRRFGTAKRKTVGPVVSFPPDGAILEDADTMVKVEGGHLPLTVLVNGAPIVSGLRERSLLLGLTSPGFSDIAVIDAAGRSTRVAVELRP